MEWKIIDSGLASAQKNMEHDELLLDKMLPTDAPILHLYEWERPSFTYGYFVDPSKYISQKALEKYGIEGARRPTGGGIVFHLCDYAFSALLPAGHPDFSTNTLENYAYINKRVIETVQRAFGASIVPQLLSDETEEKNRNLKNFCMAKPTKYDVVFQGMKIGGAAQRRRKQGLLHQGTISLAIPDRVMLEEVLLDASSIAEAMYAVSFSLLGKGWNEQQLKEARGVVKKELVRSFDC